MQQLKFNNLPSDEKLAIIKEYGKFVLRGRDEHGCKVYLYSMHRYFIEIYWHIKANALSSISLIEYADVDKHLIDVKVKL